MVFLKEMRNNKLNTKQFFIYHFYDFMFFFNFNVKMHSKFRLRIYNF